MLKLYYSPDGSNIGSTVLRQEKPTVILYNYINRHAGAPDRNKTKTFFVLCVCVVFSSHSFWTSSSLDVPAGVTQEEHHTGFLIHLFSAVRALIYLAKRIQQFLSLVDREVALCVLTIESFSTRRAFYFLFLFILVRKIPFAGIELTSQRVRRLHGYL